MLLNFSESQEHVQLTRALWLGGVRYDGYVGASEMDPVKISPEGGPLVLPHVDAIIMQDTFVVDLISHSGETWRDFTHVREDGVTSLMDVAHVVIGSEAVLDADGTIARDLPFHDGGPSQPLSDFHNWLASSQYDWV